MFTVDRVESRVGWDDLTLPAPQMAQLKEIAGHSRHADRIFGESPFGRKMSGGKGAVALFAGPSGTGKTIAAQVIAAELGQQLYRVDLAAVDNKYIGETEKNLKQLFDAAEAADAVLFFDEADALFGKRSPVKDSHDRYANIEVNYLLQRIAAFAGTTIVAVDRKAALDPAFLRRFRFVVDFPRPGME